MALRSALLLSAEQVIAIGCLAVRLSMAAAASAITVDFKRDSVIGRLNESNRRQGSAGQEV
jgi:threonine dehydrogenase-like Zn-dependent dehydrogenase